MPFKVFTNGVPLPASDLNDYLMEQSIATFASSAARTTAITSPTEGQFTFLADTNAFEYWDGSAWVSASGGATLLSTTTLSGSTTVISSIPSTYNDLILVVKNYRPSADASLLLRVNSVTTQLYRNGDNSGGTAPADTSWTISSNNQDSSVASNFYTVVNLPNYADTTTFKYGFYRATGNNATTPTYSFNRFNPFSADVTAAISSLTLLPSTGTFTSGTALLYGVK